MNYLPYCGYWFYDPDGTEEMHIAYVSWGLLMAVPGSVPVPSFKRRIGLLVGVY